MRGLVMQPQHAIILILHFLYRFNSLFAAFGDEFGREVRQLLQVRVFAPHSLGHHLRQFHGGQSGGQPSVGGQHIDTSLR